MTRGVLISGGSGALGQALVRRFCSAGDQVAFSYLQQHQVADTLARETGASAIRADVTRAADVQALVATALDRLGQIDVLINAVGSTQVMPFALLEEEDWDEAMAVNLKSLFLVTKEVVRHMIARKAGAIVNIGSIAGQRVLDVPVHYATAKAGVCGFTVALATELKRYRIRVNTVIPGLLDGGVARNVPEHELNDYVAHCLAGRSGKMGEVADLVYFLAGEEASYINAQQLCIDGGI